MDCWSREMGKLGNVIGTVLPQALGMGTATPRHPPAGNECLAQPGAAGAEVPPRFPHRTKVPFPTPGHGAALPFSYV